MGKGGACADGTPPVHQPLAAAPPGEARAGRTLGTMQSRVGGSKGLNDGPAPGSP
jgi:hypothetical protein